MAARAWRASDCSCFGTRARRIRLPRRHKGAAPCDTPRRTADRRLADGSVLYLNTDTAVTIRYSRTERLVVLKSGQAGFEVAHDPNRPFRVFAGPAEAVAHGTEFDVRLGGRP